MTSGVRRWALRIAIAFGVGILLTLAMPVPVWRTGRLEVPPLPLIDGGQLMSRADRVWIDTDAACGVTPRTDPDDCLAIVWLAARGARIVALSSSYGNASAPQVEQTLRVLNEALVAAGMPRIPAWRGAPGPAADNDESRSTQAALRAALERGPLTILALGPLTNIAAALADRPDLQRNVVRLVAVMGHRPGHVFHPSEGSGRAGLLGHGPIFRDLNFTKDPAAAAAVLDMRLVIALVPYDAARNVRVTADDLDAIARRGPAFSWASDQSRDWLAYWRDDVGQPGFRPFDWIAAAVVTEPGLFRCARVDAWIANEWLFWLYPRPGLLIGPRAPENASVQAEVIYCPETDPLLHAYLVEGRR